MQMMQTMQTMQTRESIQNNYFPHVTNSYHTAGTDALRSQDSGKAVNFQEILGRKAEETKAAESALKFSKHAAGRLEERNIELSETQLERLQEGTVKAGEKGINESLVLMDQFAFIVNIPHNTVITAMDQTEADQNIFTNIDGAVIV